MSKHVFKLPDVGEGLGQGELLKWHVAIGEPVKADQLLCDVQTDKAIVEIPAPVDGVLREQGGQPGDLIDVGAMLAIFETDGAQVSQSVGKNLEVAEVPQPLAQTSPDAPLVAGRKVKASPATRKRARAHGIDLKSVTPTGPRGQVTPADLDAAIARTETSTQLGMASTPMPAPEPVPHSPARPVPIVEGADREEPLLGLRRQIAQTMQASWQNIPHIYTLREIDASALVDARRTIREDLQGRGVAVTYMPFLVKACVLALQENPRFNASLDMTDMKIIYRHRLNIGIATATPDGLIVTVVHDANRKSLAEIAVEIEELARLGRERKASLEQLSNGTFTISNYGSQGAWMGTPIIRPPEVAIAGFGRIEDKVIPVAGEPAVRKVLPMCVATDHRLNDGEHLGDFMTNLLRYLAAPVRMLSHL